MKTTVLAAVAALTVFALAQTPPAKSAKSRVKEKEETVFTDPYLGLQFNHPATWAVRKKNRDMTRYTVSIPGSADTADLEIRRATFHSDKDIWQTIQLRANETMKRQVVRQWEQVVIGVPMLCTQLAYNDKQTPTTTLTGLYYTKSPLKMLVRLTAPTADFDKVKYEFDQSLQSLQTTNGTVPTEDDPNFQFPAATKPQLAPPRPDVIGDDGPHAPKAIKGMRAVALVVSTKPVKIKLPPGWTGTDVKDNSVTLRNPKLPGGVFLTIHYELDSERPAAALVHATAPELDEFSPGVKREDTDATPNLEACSISTVWRMGKTAKGDLFSFHASGEQGDFYFIASYRTTSARDFAEDRKVIRLLMDEVGLDSAASSTSVP